MIKKAQVIKCKCGSCVAASMEPLCYTSKEWQKDLREAVKDGCSVHILEYNSFTFEKCKCQNHVEKTNQISLF